MASRNQIFFVVVLSIWLLVIYLLYSYKANLTQPSRKEVVVNRAKEKEIEKVDLPSGTLQPKTVDSKPDSTKISQLQQSSLRVADNVQKKAKVTQISAKSIHDRNLNDYVIPSADGLSWNEFTKMKHETLTPNDKLPDLSHLLQCSKEVVDKIAAPLSEGDLNWCKHALSPSGGQVRVGKSYGRLNAPDRDKFEQLNCNSVDKGLNPSCDDAWGDNLMLKWKKNQVPNLCGDENQYTSKVYCADSDNKARFCVFENIMLDFSKMKNTKRSGRTDSREWQRGFLSSHCDAVQRYDIGYYEQYAAVIAPAHQRCHIVMNETLLIYGHDDSKNLGHTMSDFMNVWTMLWLSGMAKYSRNITFLNMDAIRMGHNYYDELGRFSAHYDRNFAKVVKTNDISIFLGNGGGKTSICAKRVIFMPQPVMLYTWDGWWQDMRCSFVGASSLFQRFNLQVRNLYNLVDKTTMEANNDGTTVRILLIKRRINPGGATQGTRVYKNTKDIEKMLSSLPNVKLIAADLVDYSFEEQIKLISSVQMMIGIHGAGMAFSTHLPIGTKNCCGVIEIFPRGEFQAIKGYGNMARRTGHHYIRMDLRNEHSGHDGANVPVHDLRKNVEALLSRMKEQPTCVLPAVINDPYFDSVQVPFLNSVR